MAIGYNKQKFESYKEKASAEALANSGGGNSTGFSDHFIKMEIGKKYSLRLISWEPDKEANKSFMPGPFIRVFKHKVNDSNGKAQSIVCPSTFDKNVKACPICKVSAKHFTAGTEKDKALSSLYRRKFHGYALAYVVKDATNPDNVGKVKVLHFDKTRDAWLQKKLYGITAKDSKEDVGAEDGNDDIIGGDAFELINGLNLNIDVSKKGEYAEYNYDFARKATSVSTTFDELEDLITDIKFEDFVPVRPSEEKLQKYYNEFVLQQDGEVDIPRPPQSPGKSKSNVDLSSELDSELETLSKPVAKPVEVKKVAPVAAKAVPADDAFDIDEFLKG